LLTNKQASAAHMAKTLTNGSHMCFAFNLKITLNKYCFRISAKISSLCANQNCWPLTRFDRLRILNFIGNSNSCMGYGGWAQTENTGKISVLHVP